MNTPGFTADASLYKTRKVYQSGISARTEFGPLAGLVTPQFDCGTICAGKWLLCDIGCSFFDPFCLVGCTIKFVDCLRSCPDGGGGGGPPLCCPVGRAEDAAASAFSRQGMHWRDVPGAGGTVPLANGVLRSCLRNCRFVSLNRRCSTSAPSRRQRCVSIAGVFDRGHVNVRVHPSRPKGAYVSSRPSASVWKCPRGKPARGLRIAGAPPKPRER